MLTKLTQYLTPHTKIHTHTHLHSHAQRQRDRVRKTDKQTCMWGKPQALHTLQWDNFMNILDIFSSILRKCAVGTNIYNCRKHKGLCFGKHIEYYLRLCWGCEQCSWYAWLQLCFMGKREIELKSLKCLVNVHEMLASISIMNL